MVWTYSDIHTVSSVQSSAPQTVAPQTASRNGPLGQEEYQKIMNDLQSYAGTPGVGEAASRLLSSGADPQRMAQLLRQMSDAIDSVRANPHRHIPVDPAIAQVVEAVREVELKKPDPLNLLRPQENQQGASSATTSLASVIAPVLAVATLETADARNVNAQNARVENGLLSNFLLDEERRRNAYRTQQGPVPAMAMALAGVELPTAANSLQFSSSPTTSIGAALDYVQNTGPTRVPDARDPAIVAARNSGGRGDA